METNLAQELAALERMTAGDLQRRYAELHGQPSRSRHRPYLVRKIAWRLQAIAEGDLSERAYRRAAELANDAEVRVMPPKASRGVPAANGGPTIQRVATVPVAGDPRLPPPGTALSRQYKGRALRVLVLPDGFEFEGQRYRTLTAVAEAITGSHINGFRFFRLEGRP